jgi:DNA repair protein RecO (recombination protein O)
MPLIETEAIVLQAFAYSETSKVLRLLTPEHGVVSALARGALRPRSQYGGILEPFTEGTARFYLKEGRELQTLGGFELGRSRQALGRDLVRFGAASLLAELVIRTGTAGPDPILFRQVGAAFARLETAPVERVELVGLAEAWSLVARLGFAPALDGCLRCGRPLAAGEEASLDYAAGGIRCPDCANGVEGRRLPARGRAALHRLCAGEPVPVARTEAYWALLARFVGHHVVDGRPLRSLEFLAGTLENR